MQTCENLAASMLVGRLLVKDNDDDTDHGKLVTTFLNHRNDNIPSLAFPSPSATTFLHHTLASLN
jgi:hypothetical protein